VKKREREGERERQSHSVYVWVVLIADALLQCAGTSVRHFISH